MDYLKREFYERSTGLIKFNENFLVIRATEDAVFALDVLRYDSLKERRNIHEHLEVLPNNVFDVVMNEKLYLPAKRYSTLANAVAQICEYISGIRTKFELETETEAATEFQKSVWKATTEIPYGQTVSYDHIASVVSDLKEKLQPGILSRAVGSALSKNPVMIIIPCHRVIGKDGKLRGFAGGIDIKDHLLNHELTNYLRSRRE